MAFWNKKKKKSKSSSSKKGKFWKKLGNTIKTVASAPTNTVKALVKTRQNIVDKRRNFKLKKIEAKTKRKEVKLDARTERASGRQDVRKTAYENGFDPNNAWKDVAIQGINTAGAIGGALIGAKTSKNIDFASGFGAAGSSTENDTPRKAKNENNKMGLLMGIGVGVLILFGVLMLAFKGGSKKVA